MFYFLPGHSEVCRLEVRNPLFRLWLRNEGSSQSDQAFEAPSESRDNGVDQSHTFHHSNQPTGIGRRVARISQDAKSFGIHFTILSTDRFSEVMSSQQMLEFKTLHETFNPLHLYIHYAV